MQVHARVAMPKRSVRSGPPIPRVREINLECTAKATETLADGLQILQSFESSANADADTERSIESKPLRRFVRQNLRMSLLEAEQAAAKNAEKLGLLQVIRALPEPTFSRKQPYKRPNRFKQLQLIYVHGGTTPGDLPFESRRRRLVLNVCIEGKGREVPEVSRVIFLLVSRNMWFSNCSHVFQYFPRERSLWATHSGGGCTATVWHHRKHIGILCFYTGKSPERTKSCLEIYVKNTQNILLEANCCSYGVICWMSSVSFSAFMIFRQSPNENFINV